MKTLDVGGNQKGHFELGQQRFGEPEAEPLVGFDGFGRGEHQRCGRHEDALDVLDAALAGHAHRQRPRLPVRLAHQLVLLGVNLSNHRNICVHLLFAYSELSILALCSPC